MPSFNKVFLMGYLTQDPAIRSSTTGNSFCSARLAVNRRYRLQDGTMREDTVFISLSIGGRQGDLFCNSLRKGKPVFVEGHLYQRDWLNHNGEKMTATEVRVENFRFIDSKGEVNNPGEPAVGGMTLPPLGNSAGYRPPSPQGAGYGGSPNGVGAYSPPPVEPLRRMPAMDTGASQEPAMAAMAGRGIEAGTETMEDDTPF